MAVWIYSGNVYDSSPAGTTAFPLVSRAGNTIEYLQRSHIKVYSSVDQGYTFTQLTTPTDYSLNAEGTEVVLTTGISQGTFIRVQRETPYLDEYVVFQSSSLLTADQLNTAELFSVYVEQELSDRLGTIENLSFKYFGFIDITTDKAPAVPTNGTFYINTGSGVCRDTWTGIVGDPVVGAEQVIYDASKSKWGILQTPSSQSGVQAIAGDGPITVDGSTVAVPIVGIDEATTSSKGALSAADKTKLNSISSGAAVSTISGSGPITIDASNPSVPVVGITNATTSSKGALSAADKTKLDDSDKYTYPGGVLQTIQSRLEQHVSVKDFGATGDGTTDDTAAVKLAFNRVKEDASAAANEIKGGTVYFPAGTYVISDKLYYEGVDIAVRGESRSNTVIKYGDPANSGRMFQIKFADNCTFSDLTFDFNGAIDNFGGSIDIRSCQNAEVSNCAFLDLNPQQLAQPFIFPDLGDGVRTEFVLARNSKVDPTYDYQIMPGTVVVSAGSGSSLVELYDEQLADGHLFLKNPTLDADGKIAPNQTTQGQILYGSNNGVFSVRVKFQVPPAPNVQVKLTFGFADQRQPILILNCSDVLVTNNILKCLGRVKVGRPGNRVVITNNIINGCNDNAVTVVNVNPTGEDADPATVSPQYKLITSEMIISGNNVGHAGTNAIFWGGDGPDKVPYPLEFENILVTNNNIVCSGGSAMKFVPSENLEKSGRIIIANNNIKMQHITKDDNTIVKIFDSNLFTLAIDFASAYANDIVVSNNNIDFTGATLSAIGYSTLVNCVISGNRFFGPSQRIFRGNNVSRMENCVINNNSFTCSNVIAPSQNSSEIKDTTFVGNVLASTNVNRQSGCLVDGGSLTDVTISNNIFRLYNVEFGDFVIGDEYVITAVGDVNWKDFALTLFGDYVIGQTYVITEVGTTDWTNIGGPQFPGVGANFEATSNGLSEAGTTGKGFISKAFIIPGDTFTAYGTGSVIDKGKRKNAGASRFASSLPLSSVFLSTETAFGGFIPKQDYRITDVGDTDWGRFVYTSFGDYVIGVTYVITKVSDTDWTKVGGPASASVDDEFIATGDGFTVNVAFGNYLVNKKYKITSVGTDTNWAAIGGPVNPSNGDKFLATNNGSSQAGTNGTAEKTMPPGGEAFNKSPAVGTIFTASTDGSDDKDLVEFGSYIINEKYKITEKGNTDWTTIGGPANPSNGDKFLATSNGSAEIGTTGIAIVAPLSGNNPGEAVKLFLESSFQITNNHYVGSLYWNPDIVRTTGNVTFASGTTKFPNSGPRVPVLVQGTNSPENVITAYNGSVFIDTSDGTVYSKKSGGASNQNWVTQTP